MVRLHRSKRNKVILGVCGGLAEYFRIDPTLVRIICIITAFSGVGFFIYLVAALLMPEDNDFASGDDQWKSGQGANTGAYTGSGTSTGTGTDAGSGYESEFNSDADDWDRPAKYNSDKNKLVLGAILVGLGVLFLIKQIIPTLFDLRYMIPLLLIAIGGIIVFKGRR